MFGEGEPEVDCALVPIVGWGDYGITFGFEIICFLVPTTTPMGTWGNSIVRLKWGESIVGTSPYSPHPTSVMAFHESTLDECEPFVSGGVQAACSNDSDSSYVEDSGYEAKIVISDSACQASTRSGDDSDIANDCFYFHRWSQTSDLPEFYQDTTLGDAGSILVIGFGSANGAALDPGHTYTVRQFFKSPAQPIMLGTKAMHVGSITSELLSGAACILGGFADNMCHYAVDIASVGGASGDTFEQVVP